MVRNEVFLTDLNNTDLMNNTTIDIPLRSAGIARDKLLYFIDIIKLQQQIQQQSQPKTLIEEIMSIIQQPQQQSQQHIQQQSQQQSQIPQLLSDTVLNF